MGEDATTPPPAEESSGDTPLAILLAMAMFVRCLPIDRNPNVDASTL